jgi:hypothetical protein
MVLTVPFMFGVHDFRDYHRFTPLGMQTLAERHGLSLTEVRRRGGVFVAATGLVRTFVLNSIVGRPRDWRAQGRDKKVRWVLSTVVLTPWTPITWLAYLLDRVLDRESVSPPGLFFLLTKVHDDASGPAPDTTEEATTTGWARAMLRCPVDRHPLTDVRDDAGRPALHCEECGRTYPVEDGVSILLPPGD